MGTPLGTPTPPIAPIVGVNGAPSDAYRIFFNNLVAWIAGKTRFGTFAARPAADTVYPGTLYDATDTDQVYISDGTTWHAWGPAGSTGTVTHTGALTSGRLIKGNGGADITVGDLTGDVTTAGTMATSLANLAVTTSKIAASAVTLAKIANALASSRILGSGAAGIGGPYVELTLGSNLVMNGTTLDATTGGVGGAALVLLEQHTAAGGTEMDFVASISAAYDEYLIEIVNLVSSAADTPQFQVSTNGGSTYDTGGNYDSQGYVSQFAGGGGDVGDSSVAGMHWRPGGLTLGANGSWNGSVRLCNPGGALYKIMFGQLSWSLATQWATAQMIWRWRNTAAMDAFRINMQSGGTLTSGTVRCYGISK